MFARATAHDPLRGVAARRLPRCFRPSATALRLPLALALLWAALGGAAPPPEVAVERRGETFFVRARAAVDADAAIAWGVLTDYNRLAEFVPDLLTSRLVSAPGERPRLVQEGEAGFLLWRFRLRVELEIEETPGARVAFRAVGGNLRRMQGAWRIERADNGSVLVYDAELEPGFWVPPLIGPALMRSDVAGQIAGVVREVERRRTAGANPIRNTP